MQITGQKPTWFDGDGDPLVGGKVFFYETGTSTPIGIFSDADQSAPADNPVILDSRGQPSTAIFIADGAVYDVYVYDADDVLQESALGLTAPLTTGTTPFATAAEALAGVVSTKAISPAVAAAVYSRLDVAEVHTAGKSIQVITLPIAAGAVTPDIAESTNFRVNLSENITVNNPTNKQHGHVLTLILEQDATGGRTVSWHSVFKFAAGAPSLVTTANAKNKVVCQYDIADTEYLCDIGAGYT